MKHHPINCAASRDKAEEGREISRLSRSCRERQLQMNTLVYILGASLIAQASYVLHDAMERGPSWLPANMWLFNKLYAVAGIGLVGVVLGAGLTFRWQIAIGVILASQVGSWLIGRVRRANCHM